MLGWRPLPLPTRLEELAYEAGLDPEELRAWLRAKVERRPEEAAAARPTLGLNVPEPTHAAIRVEQNGDRATRMVERV
jgi:hypothetical protein